MAARQTDDAVTFDWFVKEKYLPMRSMAPRDEGQNGI